MQRFDFDMTLCQI